MSIADHLLAEAKRVAASAGRTLSQVVEDALRESFARPGQPERHLFRMPTFRGQGVLPGVDLDDSAGLQELMDQTAGLDRLR
ncbi:MAG: type II toxin-antitoxin system VapB family antitoxin [Thermoleophilia bacterium]